MVDYWERLSAALAHAQSNLKQLQEYLGVSYQAMKKLEDGKTKSLSAQNSAQAAKFLGVDSHWLATGEGEMLITKQAPFGNTSNQSPLQLPDGARAVTLKYAYRVGIVQGGNNGFIEDYAPNAQEPEPVYYASTRLDEQAYAVKVRGSSMEPAVMAGWDVIASPCRPAEPPDLCAVYFTDGRKAFKRLAWVRDGMVCLESISAQYEKITEPVENIVRMDKVISIVPN